MVQRGLVMGQKLGGINVDIPICWNDYVCMHACVFDCGVDETPEADNCIVARYVAWYAARYVARYVANKIV